MPTLVTFNKLTTLTTLLSSKCAKKRDFYALNSLVPHKRSPVNYKQTLDFLYAQLPMFHRIGAAAYKNDLTNTIALCEHLGNPHQKFQSIHIGGTNGKGSVSHMLAAVCQASGMKTGLYISPHYKDFRERIKVDGQYIPRRQVVDFVGLKWLSHGKETVGSNAAVPATQCF